MDTPDHLLPNWLRANPLPEPPQKPKPKPVPPGPRYSVDDLRSMDPSEYPAMWKPHGKGYIFKGVVGGHLVKLDAVRGNKFRVRMPTEDRPRGNLMGGCLSHWSLTIEEPVDDAGFIAATQCAIKALDGWYDLTSGRD